MNREEKIERLKTQSRVSSVQNLSIDPAFIHPDFQIMPGEGVLSETGRLEILKIVSKIGDGICFTARWDHKPEHLDIDMHGTSSSAISKFKNSRDGYLGHHTSRSTDPDKRIFEIKIQTPQGLIFEGSVSFSNTYEEPLSETLELTDSVELVLTKGRSESKDT